MSHAILILAQVLKLGRSEMISGRAPQAGAFGGCHRSSDCGCLSGCRGFDAAKALVLRLWGKRVQTVEQDARDAKTALQEWAQARKLAPPKYVQTARSGPDHQPVFTISAQLENGTEASATAASKRAAEQAAATMLLAQLETDK